MRKKNKKQEHEKTSQTKKFMEASSLEEFIDMYVKFHKQELALENDFSYFDVTRSNVDGHFFGEMFDNAIRLKFLKETNKHFLEQVDEEQLMKRVKEEFEQDFKKYKEQHPEDNDQMTSE